MDHNKVFDEVKEELNRQYAIKGHNQLPHSWWFIVMSEEIGEVAKELLMFDKERLRKEIIQVAVAAIAWLEDDSAWSKKGR